MKKVIVFCFIECSFLRWCFMFLIFLLFLFWYFFCKFGIEVKEVVFCLVFLYFLFFCVWFFLSNFRCSLKCVFFVSMVVRCFKVFLILLVFFVDMFSWWVVRINVIVRDSLYIFMGVFMCFCGGIIVLMSFVINGVWVDRSN